LLISGYYQPKYRKVVFMGISVISLIAVVINTYSYLFT
jgi:hypothetical protein